MRVQSLSEGGIAEVPPRYIQPPEDRPPIHDDVTVIDNRDEDNIPMIDVFGFDSEQRDAVRKVIGDACAKWGAFHITNHGVPLELLDQIRGGYGSKMLRPEAEAETSTVLDWRDYFDHHTLPLSRRDPSRWPHFPSNYRQVVARYSDELKIVAQKLLGLISESLGLPTSCIEDSVGEFYQNITISYYPACPQPHLTLGLQSHSDMGAITLLIQDHVGGLQIFKDSQWITVHPQSHAILVILADQMEIITNGKYRSAQHRAITNSSSPRLSVATFHDPAKTAKISPASELISNSSPAQVP
ncbi:2-OXOGLUTARATE (2OG) AND FE(II)-DEPENDENT OXYGENASE SUPERFAMILY PROTEIN [Salix koriyanagi]|uniref:2-OXOGLUTARATE (2OG) AND FE(II)-DEPENDENT OXYGENASE SUPERFAMILY PROTEIN n=1 Tax=Salix koriyanagi TaxID=2511006 RepID=A0A9Q0UF00_9ROSI|nr:2-OXOGLUTARATE (2OG) AND FE(II)-DEPENDENT OXYGENASE SUPERFAMILY PROTEIN [Salix koriyanagi]